MRKRSIARVAIAAAGLVILSVPAHAATVLNFDPTGGEPGVPVVGKGVGMQGIPRLVIFLAPSHRVADMVESPRDERLERFGVMTADEGDIGHFIGEVPRVPPGRYVATAYCRECGGSLFTVGDFTVRGSLLPRTGPAPHLWLVLGWFLVVGGSVLRFLARFDDESDADRGDEQSEQLL